MLDKKSEKILKYAISKYDGNMEREILITPEYFKMDYTELNSLCKELRKKEYVYLYSYTYSNQEPAYLRLNYKGLKHFELKKKERFKYWLPIVISNIIAGIALITSIISLLMK